MEQHLDAHELTIDGVVRDLDGDGKLLHTSLSTLKQRRVNGKLKTTVVSATKDGADEQDEKNERTESPFAEAKLGCLKWELQRVETID